MMDRKTSWRKRAEKMVNQVCAAFPSPDQFENWRLCDELILSAKAICEKVSEFAVETEDSAFLLNETAYFLKETSDYSSAFSFYEQSLEIRQKIFGQNHPAVAHSLNNLSSLLKSKSRVNTQKL